MKSELYAGEASLFKFCVEKFNHPDPVFFIFLTHEPPDLCEPVGVRVEEYERTEASSKNVDLFVKENFVSMFFPNGYLTETWNLLLAVTKAKGEGGVDKIVRGWIYGIDTNSQAMINNKILSSK